MFLSGAASFWEPRTNHIPTTSPDHRTFISMPALPLGSCPYASMRASSVHFDATNRMALVRSEGGVFCTSSHAITKPWCGCAARVEKPARFFRLAPNTCNRRARAGTQRRLEMWTCCVSQALEPRAAARRWTIQTLFQQPLASRPGVHMSSHSACTRRGEAAAHLHVACRHL